MSITATVEAGNIVLPLGLNWADGTLVKIELIEERIPTPGEALKEFEGVVDDPRTDVALNHDHYLHGHRKG